MHDSSGHRFETPKSWSLNELAHWEGSPFGLYPALNEISSHCAHSRFNKLVEESCIPRMCQVTGRLIGPIRH